MRERHRPRLLLRIKSTKEVFSGSSPDKSTPKVDPFVRSLQRQGAQGNRSYPQLEQEPRGEFVEFNEAAQGEYVATSKFICGTNKASGRLHR